MEAIYGPNVPSIKGKMTRSKPPIVKEDYVAIPQELLDAQEQVTLYMDIMHMNGVPFLTSIDAHIWYCMLVYLHNWKADTIHEGLAKVLNLYNNVGFTITMIRADPEFLKLVDDMPDMHDINLEDLMVQAHVPQAKCNNCTLKERICTLFHAIRFNHMPLQVLVTLVLEATSKLNYASPSKVESPTTTVTVPSLVSQSLTMRSIANSSLAPMCRSSSLTTLATLLLPGPLTAPACAQSQTPLLVDMKSSIYQLNGSCVTMALSKQFPCQNLSFAKWRNWLSAKRCPVD